jgi:hypothetical protein
MTEDPEQVALEDLRRYQEEMGMRFADPDAPVDAPDDGDRVPGWMKADEEFR